MEVYHLYNTIEGKCYIGQTRYGVLARWRGHLSFSKVGTSPLCEAIRKCGPDAFVMTVLSSHLSQKELDDAEWYWIEFFKARDPEFGYNVLEGGHRGKHREGVKRSRCTVHWTPAMRKRHGELLKRISRDKKSM